MAQQANQNQQQRRVRQNGPAAYDTTIPGGEITSALNVVLAGNDALAAIQIKPSTGQFLIASGALPDRYQPLAPSPAMIQLARNVIGRMYLQTYAPQGVMTHPLRQALNDAFGVIADMAIIGMKTTNFINSLVATIDRDRPRIVQQNGATNKYWLAVAALYVFKLIRRMNKIGEKMVKQRTGIEIEGREARAFGGFSSSAAYDATAAAALREHGIPERGRGTRKVSGMSDPWYHKAKGFLYATPTPAGFTNDITLRLFGANNYTGAGRLLNSLICIVGPGLKFYKVGTGKKYGNILWQKDLEKNNGEAKGTKLYYSLIFHAAGNQASTPPEAVRPAEASSVRNSDAVQTAIKNAKMARSVQQRDYVIPLTEQTAPAMEEEAPAAPTGTAPAAPTGTAPAAPTQQPTVITTNRTQSVQQPLPQ